MPVLAAAFLALAATGGPPAEDAKSSPVADDKKVCRTVAATGSIIDKHVCHTRAQWRQIDADAARAFENRSNNGTIDRSQGGAGNGTDSFGQPKAG